MQGIINPQGRQEIVVPAGSSIAVFTNGKANVYQRVSFPNYPDAVNLLGAISYGQTVFGPYANGANIQVEAMAQPAQYAVGTAPFAKPAVNTAIQPTPGTLNATGALTAALMTGGIVTSTTAAAVVATVPTGTVMDAAVDMHVNDSFDFSVINTGANAFTVTAAANHTVVGVAAVAATTSGRFRTVKTAAGTFVTYRLC